MGIKRGCGGSAARIGQEMYRITMRVIECPTKRGFTEILWRYDVGGDYRDGLGFLP